MTGVYVILAVLILIGAGMYYVYNQLVSRRIRCQEQWNQVTARLKRRYDVVPNLVDLMRESAAHETLLLEQVEQARNAAILAKGVRNRQEAEDNFSYQIRRLMETAQKYPNLRTSPDFTRLKEELTSAENQIIYAVEQYNDTVREYNEQLDRLPHKYIAAILKFRKMATFLMDKPDHTL
ncbi:MAG: LemA family protein [Phycisphaerae bacterium]